MEESRRFFRSFFPGDRCGTDLEDLAAGTKSGVTSSLIIFVMRSCSAKRYIKRAIRLSARIAQLAYVEKNHMRGRGGCYKHMFTLYDFNEMLRELHVRDIQGAVRAQLVKFLETLYKNIFI
jgi:hypothetical protein